MKQIIIEKRINRLKLVTLFVIVFAIGILILHTYYKIVSNNDLVSFELFRIKYSAQNNILFSIIVLIFIIAAIIKSILSLKTLFRRYLLIFDPTLETIVLKNEYINKAKIELKFFVNEVEEILLARIEVYESGIGMMEYYPLYIIFNDKTYYKLHSTYSYSKSLNIYEQIYSIIHIKLHDITDMEYSDEYDVIKWYKKREHSTSETSDIYTGI